MTHSLAIRNMAHLGQDFAREGCVYKCICDEKQRKKLQQSFGTQQLKSTMSQVRNTRLRT